MTRSTAPTAAMASEITAEQLLDVADLLTSVPDDQSARPAAVHHRRAVSSAYYALFHLLVLEAVGHSVGKDTD